MAFSARCSSRAPIITCQPLCPNNIGEKLEDVVIEHRDYQYLYEDQSGRIFMNNETFEQIPIANDLVIGHEFMKEGDTATNTLKPATLETGVEVRVPLFINEGDLIQVDTRDGSYLARAKE